MAGLVKLENNLTSIFVQRTSKLSTAILNICFQCLTIKCANHGGDTDLLLQLVEDELHHHIVLHLQHLVDPLGDPGLQNVHLDFGHVHLLNEIIFKLHRLQQLLLLVRKAIVLIRTGALRERNVKSILLIFFSISYSEKSSISHVAKQPS